MKIVLFFIVTICCFNITSAQNVTVANEAMNVAYLGIINALTVGVEGYDRSLIIASTENGTIVEKGHGKFDYTPAKQGTGSIKVAIKKGDNIKTIGYKLFRVKEIPMPVAKFVNKQFRKGKTDFQIGIIAIPKDEDSGLKFRVVGFKATLYRNQEVIFSNDNIGNRFNAETQHGFMTWEAGDKIIFSDIHCQYPDGKTVKIENLIIN